jgi:prepilin-type N-terminal cleavage/methylation domain-containing protein
MKTKAFTLIELLVVIAIIAVLMAILMPALRAAKDHARRIHCISNVKYLALAWFMYQDDNDGELVPGHTDPASTEQCHSRAEETGYSRRTALPLRWQGSRRVRVPFRPKGE